MLMHEDKLSELFPEEKVERVELLPKSGSNRCYYRLTSEHRSLIGVYGEIVRENEAFIYIARHFRLKGLPVPEVYSVSDDVHYYLQEDLGDTSLFDAIKNGRESGSFSEQEITLLKNTIRLLPHFQIKGAQDLNFAKCYPVSTFDRRSVMWDLNYFKYCFLKMVLPDFSEPELEDDFENLANKLLFEPADYFMYRDFQSRNVMLKNGEPYFIDFQGGRKGHLYYDLASFLWQSKAHFSYELRQLLLDEYLDELGKLNITIPDRKSFYEHLTYFVLFRQLQVLGSYGFRGMIEGKSHFLESIPSALKNFNEILSEIGSDYPYLKDIADQLQAVNTPNYSNADLPLIVTIYSFSYKRGIPEDDSGNGGGFVFDCRAIHNPGKYEEYKNLTGLDEPVKKFLENDGEILRFLDAVYSLSDASVKRYLERGFTHLQLSFGCTGGRHRSVYSAQSAAQHIAQKFGVKVRLIHRELQK